MEIYKNIDTDACTYKLEMDESGGWSRIVEGLAYLTYEDKKWYCSVMIQGKEVNIRNGLNYRTLKKVAKAHGITLPIIDELILIKKTRSRKCYVTKGHPFLSV